MSYNRRLQVLHAIVSDYVKTREPVSSKALVERYNFDVSPATIRNDMAVLEEQGLIHQPHTSAGRVPTHMGYRLFVDQIAEIKPISTIEKKAIVSFLQDATDVEEIVEKSVKLLANLTNQVAVVQFPTFKKINFKYLELLQLADKKIMLIVITTTGQVSRHSIEIPVKIEPVDLENIKIKINMACAGLKPSEIVVSLSQLLTNLNFAEKYLVQSVQQVILDSLNDNKDEKILTAGSSNLVKSDDDFTNSIVPILDALEEQVVLLRLYSQMKMDKKVDVSIGVENKCDDLIETSIVTGYYGNEESKAHISIIGPTRMDYSKNMSTVQAVCSYLSKYLSQNG